MNQPAARWICFFNPKSQPKFRLDVSTVDICVELRTSEPWTFEPVNGYKKPDDQPSRRWKVWCIWGE